MDIDTIRTICKKLPAVTEGIKWGNDLCFMISERMFCVVVLEGALKVSIKVTDEEFEELCGIQGIIRAPYSARYKWILIEKPNVFNGKQWEHYISQSYQIIRSKISKKKLAMLG
jgi:predicted DNA-binding protein (MmcQ/YjbR family)